MHKADRDAVERVGLRACRTQLDPNLPPGVAGRVVVQVTVAGRAGVRQLVEVSDALRGPRDQIRATQREVLADGPRGPDRQVRDPYRDRPVDPRPP